MGLQWSSQRQKPHGNGTKEWENKETYTGVFVEGQRQGLGVHVYADQSKYEGPWLNDKRHGIGKTTLPNGDEETCNFEEDKRHGQFETTVYPFKSKKKAPTTTIFCTGQ